MQIVLKKLRELGGTLGVRGFIFLLQGAVIPRKHDTSEDAIFSLA